MPYIPKSQYTIKHTNGSELYNPASGQEYIGEYIQYGQKYFAGNTILNLKTPLKKIPLDNNTIVRDTRTFLYNQLNKKQYKKLKDRSIPIGTKPTPTEKDYEKGEWKRYFCQRVNNQDEFLELDAEGYGKLKNGEYDNFLYTPGEIVWSLTNKQLNNDNVIRLIRQFPRIQFFFNDPEEFINVNENLTAGLNELSYPDGTPYPEGSKYHIHPGKGPMEGAFHSNESHSLLIFNSSQPEITQIDIPTTPTPSYSGGGGY